MKRITFLMGLFIFSFAAFAQNYQMSPEEIEKLQMERELTRVETQQPSMDRAPFMGTMPQPGYVQPVFRDGHTGYAWNVFAGASGVPEGPLTVNLDNGTLSSIQEVDSDIVWMAAGDMADDGWYVASYDPANSGLYTVDMATGDYDVVGSMGFSMTGLAYDPVAGVMYASGYTAPNSQLYSVNLETGAATLVGIITDGIIIGIAGDVDGNLYGIKLDDNSLYSIDSSTGAGTLIGDLGVIINFAQDIAYDRDNDILYGTLYTTNGGFYEIDTDTGFATLIHTFEAEVAGFAIPYITAEDDAPAAVTDFNVVPGAMGDLEANLSWTNPDETVDGSTLTELTSVVVERNGEVIHTISNPTIGGAETYVDDDISEAGNYNYRVFGINPAGEGLKVAQTVYVGEDVPAAPGDLTLSAAGNFGQLNWDAPTEGLNGGYLSGDNLTYTVVRMPDEVEVAEDITETSFLDTSVPGIGNYFYTVTASNDIGVGGTAESNVALLGAEGILMYETFDYTPGELPPGWVIDGVAHSWSVFNSSSAGGETPELRLNWSPAATGMSRLITYPIDVEGYEELRLTFKQYLSNFSTNEGEIAAIDVSFDGGDTWGDIWEIVIEADVPAGTYELYIDVPSGETEMHFAFRFDGDSFNINQWYIDDMILEPVVEDDLVAVAITGNTTPSEGIETTYTIMVINAGTETQDDYTVKLMQEGGVEIASVAGDPIDFAETLTYELTWTPGTDDVGPTYLYGYVDFEDDEVPGNNQTPNLNVVVQSGDIVAITIGDGDNMQGLPYDFFWHYSISQTLYYPDEIGLGGGVITGIQYFNDFNEAYMDRDIMIWLGETDADDLSDGWVDPASLQLVFDGTVDFPAGENNVFINFDDIYVYGGGNLVVYSYKADDVWSSGKNFFNTDDPNSNRSLRAQRDNNPIDPVDPDIDGLLLQYFPNITMFFSTAGLGALEGTVTSDGDPLEGVYVHVQGTNSSATTDAAGFFEFPFLLPDTYDIHFSKFGYFDEVVEDVLIEEDLTTIITADMDAIPTVMISGFVGGSDFPAVGLEGAVVVLTGYDDYEVVTDADGEFEIDGVYANNDYDIHVSADGYVAYTGEVQVGTVDIELPDIILTEIAFPVSSVVAEEVAAGALVTWEEPGGEPAEFRYDDGIVDAQLGFTGTWNSVMGAVHFREAELDEISWYLTAEGGPHNTVKVWVLGLKADGTPDRDNVIYSVENVPNVDDQWNTYEFANTLEASDGFFIGLSYNGFLGLAVDDGVGEPWDFVPGTQFGVFNITDPTSEFTDVSVWGFEVNYLIRGYGLDFGPVRTNADYYVETPPVGPAPIYSKVTPAVDAGKPVYKSTPESDFTFDTRALETFNIHRFAVEDQGDPDEWTELATGVTDWEYTDTGWYDLDGGVYKYAVVAVYTNDVFAPPAFSNELALGMSVEFTVNVTTNSGDSPAGAELILANQSGNEDHIYTMTAPADGVVEFPAVWMGTYDLHIMLAGFDTYLSEGIVIDDEGMSYDAELIETIVAPFGLLVETEGYDDGEALFSWNNALADELFEGFEDGFPPAGWHKMNPDGGTGWMQLAVGTAPLPGWNVGEAIAAPEGGDFMAYVSWQEGGSAHNDQWLVTPELIAAEGYELSFYLRYFPDSFDDNVDIRISTTVQDDVAAFDIIVEELFFTTGSSENWELYTYNITDFVDAGETFYVAFREHVADNFNMGSAIMLDNVHYGTAKARTVPEPLVFDEITLDREFHRNWDYVHEPVTRAEKAFLGFNVYLNDDQVATEIAETEYMFTGLPAGEHTAGVQSVYTSGSSAIVTVDFEIDDYEFEPDLFMVTFHVNLDLAIQFGLLEGFDPEVHHIMMTGEMFGWTEPDPAHDDMVLEWLEADPMIFGITLQLEAGEYPYKYFSDLIGDGWDGGEWAGGDDRFVEVTEDMTVVDHFGFRDDEISVVDVDVEMKLYPNPARNTLNIESDTEITNIRMVDMLGQTVYSNTVNDSRHQIQVSGFQTGVYFIQMTTSRGVVTHRVQVTR